MKRKLKNFKKSNTKTQDQNFKKNYLKNITLELVGNEWT